MKLVKQNKIPQANALLPGKASALGGKICFRNISDDK